MYVVVLPGSYGRRWVGFISSPWLHRYQVCVCVCERSRRSAVVLVGGGWLLFYLRVEKENWREGGKVSSFSNGSDDVHVD
jgi:hypothetical protein